MKTYRMVFFGTAFFRQLESRFALTVLLLFLLFAVCPCHSQNSSGVAPPAQQNFALADTAALSVVGGKAEPVEYLGRKAVCLTTQANSDIFAFVNGSSIQDGVIEV